MHISTVQDRPRPSKTVQDRSSRSRPRAQETPTTQSCKSKFPNQTAIFLLDAAEIKPEKIRLIRLMAKSGHREALLLKRTGQPSLSETNDAPIRLTVTNLGGGLYRFETVNEVENGEYALNVAGTNQFFCFTVF